MRIRACILSNIGIGSRKTQLSKHESIHKAHYDLMMKISDEPEDRALNDPDD